MSDVKYPHITVELSGQDGNGFMIVGRVSSALRQAGVPEAERLAFREEAMSGDYDHLLQTAMKTVNVE